MTRLATLSFPASGVPRMWKMWSVSIPSTTALSHMRNLATTTQGKHRKYAANIVAESFPVWLRGRVTSGHVNRGLFRGWGIPNAPCLGATGR